MPTPFEAHLDVTKTLIAVVLSAVVAVGGLVFAWNARSNAQASGWSSDALVPLGIGVLVFFVMATVSFKQYKTFEQGKRGAIVRIDQNGVLDTRLGPNPIPWSAITGAEITDISNAKMTANTGQDGTEPQKVMGVVLTVTNAGEYLGADGLIESTAKAVSSATGHDKITLSHEGLKTTPQELLAAVQAYLGGKEN